MTVGAESTVDSKLAALATPVRLSPRDLVRLGLLRVRTRPMRAALSALGIAIGIATMIVVVGIPASGQQALQDELAKLGPNLLKATPREGLSSKPVVFPTESVAMVGRIGPVERVSAIGNTTATVRRSDLVAPEDNSGLLVYAASLDLPETLGGTVRVGRFLSATTEKLPAVVLGDKAATRLGITDLPRDSGPLVRIGPQWFTVVGILGPMPLAPEVERSVLVGWETARQWLGFDGHPGTLYVRARESAVEQVRSVLPRTVHPASPGAVDIGRPSEVLAAQRITQSTFSALFLGLAAVALLVGGVGVANTMVISVLERKREIGLRRALGANRRQIRAQFLTESVVLCGLGGIAGVLLGVLSTAGYSLSRDWPVVIPAQAVLGGFGAAVAVGVLAGVYPAIRASRLTPTEALAAP